MFYAQLQFIYKIFLFKNLAFECEEKLVKKIEDNVIPLLSHKPNVFSEMFD